MVEDRADVVVRDAGRSVAERGQRRLDRMGPIGDFGLPDDARRPFECMHQAQQPLDKRRAWAAFLQFEHGLRALIQKLARFQAEISIGISRHALGRHMRLDDAQQVPGQLGQ